VTALYEIIPVGVKSEFIRDIDPLKYQSVTEQLGLSNDEILTVKFRYKKPDGDKSQLIVKTLENSQTNINETSENYRFSAAVAEFGMLLRDSEFKQNASYNQALQMAKGAMSNDEFGYRSELISMIRSCQMMAEK
jgi:Ca-activated chloride channel family protein